MLFTKRIERNDLLFFLLGFVVFSPLSTTILIDWFHFPLSLPELLFIPFAYLLKNKIRSLQIYFSDVVSTALILLCLILIGAVYGEFSLYEMLSSARAWFYLLLTYKAFKRPNCIESRDLLWMSLGGLLSWMIISRLNFNKVLISFATDQGEMCTYGIILFVPIFVSLALSQKKYGFLFLGLTTILSTCIFSGIRRLTVIVVSSLLFSFLLSVLKNKGSLVKISFIVAIILFIGSLTLPIIMTQVENSSPVMYYRIFGRTQAFLESGDSESEGDVTRMKNINKFFCNVDDYIIPRGMVSFHTTNNSTVGLFNDLPILQLSWLFGFLVCMLIIIYFLRSVIGNYYRFIKNKDDTSFCMVVCLLSMGILLFLDGTFIEYAEFTPITGMILGKSIANIK